MTKKVLFYNNTIDKKKLRQIMSTVFSNFGSIKAAYLADKIKDIGFKYATQAGISISIEDLRVPPSKDFLVQEAIKKVYSTELSVAQGKITEVERFQKVISTWNAASESLKEEVVKYFSQTDPLNSIYIMAFSGARGNISQVRQLVGMRGLMADPNGQIIDLPIIANFREGLTLTDYIISSYGARKGLVDTALRTADSGYLTRRLIDVAQDIVTRERDCETSSGIEIHHIREGEKIALSISKRALGRIIAHSVYDKFGNLLFAPNTIVSNEVSETLNKYKIESVVLRSPLTCYSRRSVCQYCYGWNLAYGSLIDLGEAIGIIAAQSIGEPGTQLTMRTFHTGGVFTSEPSRQVLANSAGKIEYDESLKTSFYRTQYGETAYQALNESTIKLYDYKNTVTVITVYPKTILFVKNYQFIKKNELLMEYAAKASTQGEEKASKNILAKYAGEVKYTLTDPQSEQNNSSIIMWCLNSSVYRLPLQSVISKPLNSKIEEGQSLARIKLVNRVSGHTKIVTDALKHTSEFVQVFSTATKFTKTPLVLVKNGMQKQSLIACSYYPKRNYQVTLQLTKLNQPVEDKESLIGNVTKSCYQTKTGGLFFSPRFQFLGGSNNLTKIGGTIFQIPEFVFNVNCEPRKIKVKQGSYINGRTELCKGIFTTAAGIIDLQITGKLVRKIIIKPGKIIALTKEHLNSYLYHQQIVYPGEHLFNKVQIGRLCYCEVRQINKKNFLWLQPIIRFEVSNDLLKPEHLYQSMHLKNQVHINDLKLNITLNETINTSEPFPLVKRDINYIRRQTSNDLSTEFNILETPQSKSYELFLGGSEQFDTIKYSPNQATSDSLKFALAVCNKQFIEPYTVIANYDSIARTNLEVRLIKQQCIGNEKKVAFVGKNNYQEFYIEDKYQSFNKEQLVISREKITNTLISRKSGLLTRGTGNRLSLHIGHSYLFSKGAFLKKRQGDLIEEGELLGQIIYQRAKTGDIVQGLPRVEEILEARRPKFEATINMQPGIVEQIKYIDSGIDVRVTCLQNNQFNQLIYTLPTTARLLVGELEFINVGKPLNDLSVNPHTVLEILFLYYRDLKILSQEKAAFRSLRKVQALVVNAVQSVYRSQGVTIDDKHVEVIVKKMTGKVQILNGGDSQLLAEEFVDLEYVNYINKTLKSQNKKEILFKPVLLGITKASLKTDSFISAASFQHTTKILTQAAIEGKVDWLRGLKENVVVGRLIPTGTGFNSHTDISYLTTRIPIIQAKKFTTLKPITKLKKYNFLKV